MMTTITMPVAVCRFIVATNLVIDSANVSFSGGEQFHLYVLLIA